MANTKPNLLALVRSKTIWASVGTGILFSLLAGFIFFPLFHAPFYQDDAAVILLNRWIREIPPGTWYAQPYFDSNYIWKVYRPTVGFSYWFNQLFVPGPLEFSLRLGNLVILIVNGILVAKLFGFLQRKNQITAAGWLVGLMYVLHPIQTLGVVYVWKRGTLLCTFFILMGLTHFIKRNVDSKKYDIKFIVFQLFCFVGAMTSKEEGIIYPLLVSLCAFIFSQRNFSKSKSEKFTWIAFHSGVLLLSAGLVYWLTRQNILTLLFQQDRLDYLKQSLHVIPVYFRDMVVPRPFLFAEPPHAARWVDMLSATTISLFLMSVVAFFAATPKWLKVSVILIWLGFLPNSTLQPLLITMDQIRMVLPLVGFCILVGALIDYLPTTKMKYLCMAAIILVYAIQTNRQSIRYLQPISIWNDIIEAYPKSRFAWDQLGTSFEKVGNYKEAAKAFRVSYDIDPSAKDELIRALTNQLRSGESIESIKKEYKKITLSETDRGFGDVQMAILQMELGLYDDAQATLIQFLENYPFYAEGHYILGMVFERKKMFDLSRQAYLNTLRLNPDYAAAKAALENLPSHM